MTRDDVAAEVAARIGTMLAEVDIPETDTPGALKEPIDDALAMMGYARSERATAEPDDDRGDLFVAAVTYTALVKVVRILTGRFNLSADGDSYSLKQVFDNAKLMLDDARNYLVILLGGSLGGSLAGSGVFTAMIDTGFVTVAVDTDEYGLSDL